MGLDVSHDCWGGPYSQFYRFRLNLNGLILCDRKIHPPYYGHDTDSLKWAWETGVYDDQSVPLNVLMAHSDCDGKIAAEVCAPLADALQDIADRLMPTRGTYDDGKPAVERFIAGLRRAADAGEEVTFG